MKDGGNCKEVAAEMKRWPRLGVGCQEITIRLLIYTIRHLTTPKMMESMQLYKGIHVQCHGIHVMGYMSNKAY